MASLYSGNTKAAEAAPTYYSNDTVQANRFGRQSVSYAEFHQQQQEYNSTVGKNGYAQHLPAPFGPPPPMADAAGTPLSSDMPVSIRHGFIRKVYAILTAELVVTAAIAAAIAQSTAAQSFVARNRWIMFAAMFVSFGVLIALSCCQKVARSFPLNFILLAVLALAKGFLLGIITIRYNAGAVGIAVGMTAGVFFACTLFAIQTKYDFTGRGAYLFVGVIVLLLFGIVASFFMRRFPILQTIYAAIGCLLFSMYIVYDTQLIVGGKNRKHQLSVDDYVFAALALYIDIINLFMLILMLFDSGSRH
eukprot:TRINITY_DN114952_c0_g1_i1.p1 TRINITY_DN114952_c0_g1~~TRINITY_DN114952_c0_g1_i1.p1  ORF type:complete len:305 (+),score=28.24 TRINITY_DN114952_c0_g1_i1:81-995(+)